MDSEVLDKELQEAVQRFEDYPEGHAYASRQDSYSLIESITRSHSFNFLAGQAPSLVELPHQVIVTTVDIVCSAALAHGSRAFACLARDDQQPPEDCSIPFSKLHDTVEEALTENSELFFALRATNQSMGVLEVFLDIIGASLLQELARHYDPDVLSQHQGLFQQMIKANIFQGTVVEFSFGHLAGSYVTQHVAEDEEPLPWPQDQRCICGANLGPVIFCSDPDELHEKQGSAYLVLADSDDDSQQLDGLRCNACGRFFSWRNGIVSKFTLM